MYRCQDILVWYYYILTVCDQRPAEPLRVMVLKNIQYSSSSAYTRIAPGAGIAEVYQERQTLLARRRNLQCPLQHENQMLYLLGAVRGILLVRKQVQAGTAIVIESK